SASGWSRPAPSRPGGRREHPRPPGGRALGAAARRLAAVLQAKWGEIGLDVTARPKEDVPFVTARRNGGSPCTPSTPPVGQAGPERVHHDVSSAGRIVQSRE